MTINGMLIKNHEFGLSVGKDLSFRLQDLSKNGQFLAAGQASLDGIADLPSTPDGFTLSGPDSVLTDLGSAQRYVARAEFRAMTVALTIDQYEAWPDAFVLRWEFENCGESSLSWQRLAAPQLTLGETFREGVWTLQGPAVAWGQDFAFRLPVDFQRQNNLGQNERGEGGGIPLIYVWNRSAGLALAHIEPYQALWYMPVESTPTEIHLALEDRRAGEIQPRQRLNSLRVLISLHRGDFYAPLALYREVLARQGIHAPAPNAEDFQAAWCSWGYEFDVRPEEVTGVLPVLEEMGIHWLTLDDRWFDAYGDWNPRSDTFPGGEAQVRAMVKTIHGAGALAQIWWYPLCAEDGTGSWESHTYGHSELIQNHPDWVILNADGSVARNNRGLAELCPALPDVRKHLAEMTRRFIQDWDFDGHKLDNIYTVAPCYNPAHHHSRPEESVEAFPEAYRLIFDLTRQLKPFSVTQICPCGTPLTHTLIPYTDQTVTADPLNSAQIRQRIKFYKALMGPRSAVFADHVELSDGGIDFASEIGTGGVPATKFVWPEVAAVRARLKEWWGLDEEKRALWATWMRIYSQHPLAQGEYLNHYDLAFDTPEVHVVRLGKRLYYGLFTSQANQKFAGVVDLRGLDACAYRIRDYVHEIDLGRLNGPTARLPVEFTGSLLIYAEPVDVN
jgi:alpha-galactosidase